MTTPAYDIGDQRQFTATFKNTAGAPTDPTTAVLTIREPDGLESTPTVSAGGTGIRNADWMCAKVGRHIGRWTGTGAVVTAAPFEFYVRHKGMS